jgi:MYXO-CTERM domain-containing protein
MPINLRILQLSATGPGRVEEDNQNVIESLLATRFGSAPGPDDDLVEIRSSRGCSTSAPAGGAPSSSSALLSLAALAAFCVARRRRGDATLEQTGAGS